MQKIEVKHRKSLSLFKLKRLLYYFFFLDFFFFLQNIFFFYKDMCSVWEIMRNKGSDSFLIYLDLFCKNTLWKTSIINRELCESLHPYQKEQTNCHTSLFIVVKPRIFSVTDFMASLRRNKFKRIAESGNANFLFTLTQFIYYYCCFFVLREDVFCWSESWNGSAD